MMTTIIICVVVVMAILAISIVLSRGDGELRRCSYCGEMKECREMGDPMYEWGAYKTVLVCEACMPLYNKNASS